MPAPDPDGITLGDSPRGRISVLADTCLIGNRKARMKRAVAILRNLQRGGWCCSWCEDAVPLYKRADARFCCEGCRKGCAARRGRSGALVSSGG